MRATSSGAVLGRQRWQQPRVDLHSVHVAPSASSDCAFPSCSLGKQARPLSEPPSLSATCVLRPSPGLFHMLRTTWRGLLEEVEVSRAVGRHLVASLGTTRSLGPALQVCRHDDRWHRRLQMSTVWRGWVSTTAVCAIWISICPWRSCSGRTTGAWRWTGPGPDLELLTTSRNCWSSADMGGVQMCPLQDQNTVQLLRPRSMLDGEEMLSGSSPSACGELRRWKRWETRFWTPTQDVILSPLRHLSATCGYLLWRSAAPACPATAHIPSCLLEGSPSVRPTPSRLQEWRLKQSLKDTGCLLPCGCSKSCRPW